MSDEIAWREPLRARRIRDRDRLRARAWRIVSLIHRQPDGIGRSGPAWVDRSGRARRSLASWEDLAEFRWTCAVRRAGNRQPCSCWGCGNPRRHFGEPSQQERRFLCAAAEQMEESLARPRDRGRGSKRP